MGKLKEYLSLLPRGMKNIDKVIEGVVNSVKMEYGHLSEDKVEEITRRQLICSQCPFMSKNATTSEEYFSLKGEHYSSSREDDHCTFCGCPLRTRTSSLESSCGAVGIPLKWEKYDNT